MSEAQVTITYEAEWRSAVWDDEVPSREAWFVTCSEHERLGKDSSGEPWGYALASQAQGVATRHRRALHGHAANARA